MTRWMYEARLVPIGVPVRLPDAETRVLGAPETFHDKSFEIERTAKTKPEIWCNHDRGVKVGNVWMLYVSRGWWMASSP